MLEIDKVNNTFFADTHFNQTNQSMPDDVYNDKSASGHENIDASVMPVSVLDSNMREKLQEMQREILKNCFTKEARVEVNQGNLNRAISIAQEFREIADALEKKMEQMAKFVESLAAKDLSGSDDTAFIKQMRMALMDLNLSTRETPVKNNPLLGEGGHDIQISTDDGAFIVLKAEDFSINIEVEDLTTAEGIEALIVSLHERMKFITKYDSQLQNHIQSLSSINTYLELEIAGSLTDPNGINPGIAGEIAALAASQILEQTAVTDLNYDVDANRILGLLRGPIL